ncbi:MAG: DEAD/DEAH box helicase [Verrucomicrobiota bacterium]
MSITFDSLALGEPIQRALRERDYTTPSPIQEQTIPFVLEGHDVMGCAQTGTGKTAAFALPILEHLVQNPRKRTPKSPRVLVIAPTRELAIQIEESFAAYGTHVRFQSEVIFGGVGQNPQVRALQKGPEVLVATPGRLLDLIGQGHVSLKQLEVFVIDEADRMLDMGFIHDVRKIVDLLPARRQSLFFSATMPDSIIQLAGTILNRPKHVEVTPPATTVEKIDQRVCHVAKADKRELLTELLRENKTGLALVFTGMKHVANRIAEHLDKNGISAAAIHGNKSQTARVRALESFRQGETRVLVATDIAARGIDVKGIELVINFDLPNEPDSYVHRIGRTARAGTEGRAIAFCDELSQGLLRDIEKNIRMSIPVDRDHAYHRDPRPGDKDESQQQQSRRERGGQGRRRNGKRSSRNHHGAGDRSGQSRAQGRKRRPADNGNRNRRRRPSRSSSN